MPKSPPLTLHKKPKILSRLTAAMKRILEKMHRRPDEVEDFGGRTGIAIIGRKPKPVANTLFPPELFYDMSVEIGNEIFGRFDGVQQKRENPGWPSNGTVLVDTGLMRSRGTVEFLGRYHALIGPRKTEKMNYAQYPEASKGWMLRGLMMFLPTWARAKQKYRERKL